jgi:hypothetical protein
LEGLEVKERAEENIRVKPDGPWVGVVSSNAPPACCSSCVDPGVSSSSSADEFRADEAEGWSSGDSGPGELKLDESRRAWRRTGLMIKSGTREGIGSKKRENSDVDDDVLLTTMSGTAMTLGGTDDKGTFVGYLQAHKKTTNEEDER